MKATRSCTLALAILFGPTLMAGAALRFLTPEELTQSAELVITGTVVEIEVREDGEGDDIDWRFKIQADVGTVEKGDGAKAGDQIRIDCWKVKVRPDGWAGPSGHYDVPAKGSKFKMWLRESGSGWEPLMPNGIELLEGSKPYSGAAGEGEGEGEGESESESESESEGQLPGWFSPAVLVGVLVLWLFLRSMFRSKPRVGSVDGGYDGGGDGDGGGGGE